MNTLQQERDQQLQCTGLLNDSCSIYSEISSLYQKLETNISAPSEMIQHVVEQLESTQQRARNIDESIKQSLHKITELTEKNKSLLKKRELLLQDSVTRNKDISLKASAIKSHIQHEASALNKNRNAINGYKPSERGTKNIINNTF